MVFSASSVASYAETGQSWSTGLKQALFVAVGVPAMLVASRLPVRFYRAVATPALLLAVGMLVVVLVVAEPVSGARSWIPLGGGFNLQPAEFAKLALVLWGADLLVRKQRLLGDWRHLFVPLLPVTAFVLLLIMLQPDLGTSVATTTILFGLLWVVGAPLRWLGVLFATVAGPGGAARAVRALPGRPPAVVPRPVRRRPGLGVPGGAELLRAVLRRLVRRRARRQPGEVVRRAARGPHRLRLRDHRRGARPARDPHRAGR